MQGTIMETACINAVLYFFINYKTDFYLGISGDLGESPKLRPGGGANGNFEMDVAVSKWIRRDDHRGTGRVSRSTLSAFPLCVETEPLWLRRPSLLKL
ncbi:MAG: hypothetical protein ABW223_11640 [Rariglobus sp.]